MPPITNTDVPETPIDTLTTGAQLFVWSASQWLACAQTQRCVFDALSLQYTHHSAQAAVPLLDELMTVLAVGAYRQIALGCLCSNALRDDELTLLSALRFLQQQNLDRAMHALDPLMGGSIKRAFCRSAEVYVSTLQQADLNLCGVAYLKPVTN